MKIGIITPLFPPDIAEPAPYSKELATRLSKDHNVTVLLYGKLPEAAGSATLRTIPKNTFLPLRLSKFTRALWQVVQRNDVLLVQNGPATELPALLLSYLTKTPIIVCISDVRATTQHSHRPWHKWLHTRTIKQAAQTISVPVNDLKRPEKHPLQKTEVAREADYESAWTRHLRELKITINKV